MGLMGLVVDFGWSYYRKTAARAAAESAAIAAAVTASNKTPFCVTLATCQASTNCPANPPTPPVTNMDAGCLYAKQNGFQSTGNVTVSMSGGKTGAPVATSPDYWASATVTERIPQIFSAVMRHPYATLSVRSTAGVFLHPAAACIYALAPTGVGFSVNGTITIQSGCGIYVDSADATSAMTGGGNSVITASQINVVGGFNPNGGTSISPKSDNRSAEHHGSSGHPIGTRYTGDLRHQRHFRRAKHYDAQQRCDSRVRRLFSAEQHQHHHPWRNLHSLGGVDQLEERHIAGNRAGHVLFDRHV
jgi:hypothetical protein